MKAEKHLAAWLLGTLVVETLLVDGLLKQLTAGILGRSAFMASYLQTFLAFDVGFGACLLPVVAGLRRGSKPLKRVALTLLLPPLLYIIWRLFTHSMLLLHS